MDAISLLENDHVALREMLARLADTTTREGRTREALLARIAVDLKIHTMIEEEILYPAFRKAGKTRQDDTMYFEALEEHRAAGELVLKDLQAVDPSSAAFSGRAKVLRELVEHHADEEEANMFPRIRELMRKEDLAALGGLLAVRKQQLQSDNKALAA